METVGDPSERKATGGRRSEECGAAARRRAFALQLPEDLHHREGGGGTLHGECSDADQ